MAALLDYKCPCCGGEIKFDSASQMMKCPFCTTEFEVETLKAYDEDLQSENTSEMNWETSDQEWTPGETEGLREYICDSCGGTVVGSDTTAATECPFCGSPVVMKGQFRGDLKPDVVIPFKLDKEAAKAGLLKHLQGKPLLPNAFKTRNHIDEVKGVYVPFWLFDSDVDAKIQYKAVKERSWSDNQYRYTEKKYYSVFRSGTIGFDHVPVDGSSQMDDALMESIGPFKYDDAVDFQTAYLSGYLADKYDVTMEQCIDRANERVKNSTSVEFRKTVTGYNSVTEESSSYNLTKGEVKYALYPVWLLSTTWNGNHYLFAMNGQTGKFVGNLPTDKKKLALFRLGFFAAGFVLAFIIGLFMFL